MKSFKALSFVLTTLSVSLFMACGGDSPEAVSGDRKVVQTGEGYSVELVTATAVAKQCVGEIKCTNSAGVTVVSCSFSNAVCGARCPTGYGYASGTCDIVTPTTPTPTPTPPTPSN